MNKDKFLVKDGNRAEWSVPEGYPWKEERVSVDISSLGNYYSGAVLYKVSDNLPEIKQLGDQLKVWKDEQIRNMDITLVSQDYFCVSEFTVVVIYKDGVSINDFSPSITFPEKGVYFRKNPENNITGVAWDKSASESDIIWDGSIETIYPIAAEFLPDGCPWKEETMTMLFEQAITLNEVGAYNAGVDFINLENGKRYVVTLNDTDYLCMPRTISNIHYLGNANYAGLPYKNSEPFFISPEMGAIRVPNFANQTIIIKIATFLETTHPISSDFLPLATQTTAGAMKQAAAVANVTAAPTAEEFNALLKSLRDAGILATS